RGGEAPESAWRGWIDEADVGRGPVRLDEGQTRGIVVEAVALGVEGDLAGRDEAPRSLGEVGSRLDPVGSDRRDGVGPAQAFVSRSACSRRSWRRRSGSRASSWVIT